MEQQQREREEHQRKRQEEIERELKQVHDAKAKLKKAQAYIGMEIVDAEPSPSSSSSSAPPAAGVIVSTVYPQGEAAKAGLRVGVVISHLNGIPTQSRKDFARVMRTVRAGDGIAFTAVPPPHARFNVKTEYNVRVAATKFSYDQIHNLKKVAEQAEKLERLVKEIKTQKREEKVEMVVHVEVKQLEQKVDEFVEVVEKKITRNLTNEALLKFKKLHLYIGLEIVDGPGMPGVKAQKVFPGQPAYLSGIRENDIITSLCGQPTKTREQFERAIKAHKPKPGDLISVSVIRSAGAVRTEHQYQIEVGAAGKTIEQVRLLKLQIERRRQEIQAEVAEEDAARQREETALRSRLEAHGLIKPNLLEAPDSLSLPGSIKTRTRRLSALGLLNEDQEGELLAENEDYE